MIDIAKVNLKISDSPTISVLPSGGAVRKVRVGVKAGAVLVDPSSVVLKGDKGDKGDTGSQGIQGIQGIQGVKGDDGAPGSNGVGVPVGGAVGQVLAKTSSADYATTWVNQSGGGGASGVFVQETRPVAAGPWLWWQTDADGNLVDLTVNDGA